MLQRFCPTAVLLAGLTSASGQVNVLTYHNDFLRTGANTNETVLAPANVNTNTFGLLFAYPVDGQVYAQPLYVSGLAIPGQGTHNVVFVATMHDSVYAFDADSNAGTSGGLLWHVSLGTSAVTPNSDFGNRYGAYHDIRPEVGIVGTPVIDLAAGTLFVAAFTHEGSSYVHRVHALNILTGAEQPNSPVVVSASIPGTGVGSAGGVLAFDPKNNGLQRVALTLAAAFFMSPMAGSPTRILTTGGYWVSTSTRCNNSPITFSTPHRTALPQPGAPMPVKAASGWAATARASTGTQIFT